MQNFCKFVALYSQKFNVNVIKTAHRRSNFLKTLVLQEIFAIPRIFDLESVIHIFTKNPVNVGMRTEVRIYNKTMYLHNKNILEYVEIIETEPRSMIMKVTLGFISIGYCMILPVVRRLKQTQWARMMKIICYKKLRY